ncbi:MAG: carbohydrate kinase [Planctomycetes bacterium]|nr:carbohydrate kinase [Planctomycetota bacterium]
MTNPIVGIGELLWDVYPDGRKVAGGAPFNFAFHCHQLGHPAVIVSRVGNDDLGRELRERVRELGLSDEYIQTDDEHPTGTVQVTLDANAVPTYTITENVAWDHIAWDEKLAELALAARTLCFGTLAQRTGTPVALQRMAETVRGRRPPGLVVFDVNLRGAFFHPLTLRGGLAIGDWVKVNEDEFAILDGLTGLRWSSSPYGDWPHCGVTIMTRGSGGCEVYRCWEVDDGEGGEWYPDERFSQPGVSAKVVDTVGAGDAFTAAMVCLHLEGRPLRECAKFAVHYAARVCEQPGGTPRIDRREVELVVFQK